ncbi:MAG: diaminopropionate ammonia-lyase, partial [Oscillospiraceae bacterium]|nr:diaminopropionate ammonia-lyase [Oscillospiraceae bacterium]
MPEITKQTRHMEILSAKSKEKSEIPPFFGKKEAEQARRFHKMLSAYNKTPLVSLGSLAKKLGVGKILVKDESKRFGLNSFKGLGGSFAMFQILCRVLGLDPDKADIGDLLTPYAREKIKNTVFVTATDG